MQRYVVMLIGCLLFLPLDTFGQTYLRPAADFRVSYLFPDSRDFQAGVRGAGSIRIGHDWPKRKFGVSILGRLGMTRHLKNESKRDGNLFQTEATKVLEFRRGLTLVGKYLPTWGEIQAGGWIGRRSVHWMDRDCDCFYNSFPRNYQTASEAKNKPTRRKDPGIAYHDGLRPYFRVQVGLSSLPTPWLESGAFSLQAYGPAYRWHEVTLPYPDWTVTVQYSRADVFGGRIELGGDSHFGGLIDSAVEGYINYHPIPGLQFGFRYGRRPYPGYERPLHRRSVFVLIDLSSKRAL